MKRLFDFILAITGLIVFSPILLSCIFLILICDSGPVFFRQDRVGYGQKIFRIWKFRTMKASDKVGSNAITVSNDSRVTKVGYWLRRYKVDELPQLINVLQGDMSFVGPRPEVPQYVAYYSDEVKRKIFSVSPGITDYASIYFRNENELLEVEPDAVASVYVEKILPEKLRLSVEYIDQASIWLDIKIIFKTIVLILR